MHATDSMSRVPTIASKARNNVSRLRVIQSDLSIANARLLNGALRMRTFLLRRRNAWLRWRNPLAGPHAR